ncbi:uncharacterized protein LOC117124472 isoform X2 [Anneissia japonica]|uniref:uncharacterized protein LOC117124472 isoform X1 n=1 Tax=Anneissia japonica TaxID=1529436 RepID=UPI0014256815|nr:uncharacterized protein LOC117124472 isoform X1 [Anneissia japonica]XP_033126600.1 uncharacterized protein LOC117124472 isoform X2 [Anneissia japonica]
MVRPLIPLSFNSPMIDCSSRCCVCCLRGGEERFDEVRSGRYSMRKINKMSAPMKHKLCRILRRCNLNFMLVFLFVASTISVFVTYLYVNTVFGDFNEESDKYLLHFEKHDDILVNIDTDDDDDVDAPSHRVNLIVNRIINKQTFEINGWWMPSQEWTTEIDCNTGKMTICSKSLIVQCKQNSVRAIYQYLPLKQGNSVRGLYFAAKSSSVNMQEDHQFAQLSMYSAIAYLKFNDGTTQILRLDYPGGSHSYTLAEIETTFINNKTLVSIMVVLGCYGYQGVAKFVDVTITPINNGSNSISSSYLISRCPRNIMKPNDKDEFMQEVMITSEQNEGVITLVTQLSMDDIQLLTRVNQNWDDQLSVALYVPTKSESKDSGHEWQRLYINKKIKPLKAQSRTNMIAVFANTMQDEYPVNFLRNLALRQSTTDFIFIIDADFLPSPNFKESFLKWLDFDTIKGNMDKIAFVVPAFEFQDSAKEAIPPASKEDLVKDVYDREGSIVPYQYLENPDAHRLTNYPVWYRSKEPYKVTGYQDQYEPYVILRRTPSLPEHNEHFSSSLFNKVSFTMELKAAGYEFLVLPDVWAIHMPHRQNSHSVPPLKDPPQLDDHVRRFEFVSSLLTRYGIGRCMHRLHDVQDKQKPGRFH